MAQLAAGDEDALAELLRRYDRPLSHFIYRNTGGRDVEDLFQETWLRVVRAAPRFDTSRRFSTWLFQIAVNLCRDWHRRAQRERLASGELVESGLSGGQEASVGERVDAALLLERLPALQREVLILRYYHDLSERQMAEILDCPAGTVKSRLHNALARLSAIVRGEAA